MQMNSAHHSGTVCLQQTHLMTPVSVVHDSRVSPPGNKRSPTTRRPTSPGRRIHTLRLVRPTDGATICARADRVLPTRHEPRHGMSVCEEYLTTLSCPEESQCSKVHVAAEHVWDFIQLDFDQTTSFCEGFKVHCYMPDMSWYYIIPSEFIFKTRGSADYVTDYNECGINSKNKFTLCTNMVKDKKCMLGRCCKDIHTSLPDLSHVEGNSTHLVDPSWLPKYPRLGSEVVVRVFNQNSGEDYCDFPGDQVLVTEGAEHYLYFL
uniref:Uncharacterized protein TCIL3000_10_4310 n=1 Tax=Trypanosoma congolense (strain IL3000) TaxID=1068625 RepID=G0UWA2_TRYCI|nr:unnamed protein product [Trypanosoma congolense IL3000]